MYQLRPMNCPFHIAVYKHKQYSYRDLPLRFAELGTVYRYERSGTMHGLFRVRGFTQVGCQRTFTLCLVYSLPVFAVKPVLCTVPVEICMCCTAGSHSAECMLCRDCVPAKLFTACASLQVQLRLMLQP